MDVNGPMSKAMEQVHAGRSYGPVIERGDCTVIPAAYVMSAGGGGGGEGPDASGTGTGSGGGAGHWSVSWPVGAYVVRDGKATWVPAIDATRVVIAVLALTKLAVKLRSVRRWTSPS
jgi:uncharacterized spore protein YtfJ